MPSELETAFAKRRSLVEDVLDNSAPQPSADATKEDLPPWLEGVVFVEAGKSGDEVVKTQESPGLPPWFDAAVERGVTFYDPEGREVVVPSHKVPAFKAALETVIEFEPEPCKGPLPAVPASVAATAGTVADAPSSATGSSPRGAAASSQAQNGEEDAETLRRELKANLQKRYFALLRSGLEPNEAAAQAILEAGSAGRPPAASRPDVASHKPAAAPLSRGCARSDVSQASSDSRRSSSGTEITVSA